MEHEMRVTWQEAQVTSPHISTPVSVIAAKDVPYLPNSNRLQNVQIYLPKTEASAALTGTHQTTLPQPASSKLLVYLHGGAWRDPLVLANSIEPVVAEAFKAPQSSIAAVASINYSLSPYPTHPTHPYDPAKGDQNDAAREVQHPKHVVDVIAALDFLHRVFGLRSDGYILAGHSCGATLALQATFLEASHWTTGDLSSPPKPAAILGLNGLFDLPMLVHKPDTHKDLTDGYAGFLKLAFGDDEADWARASPTQFSVEALSARAQEGKLPRLVVLDQSKEDQLVPMNQMEAMEDVLKKISGLTVLRGHQMKGLHNAAWESGMMIWQSTQDALIKLAEVSSTD